MSFLKTLLGKFGVTSKKVVLVSSFDYEGVDNIFENSELWNVVTGKPKKHTYPKRLKNVDFIDFSSTEMDIEEVLNSRYGIVENAISPNAPWDIEEEIKQVLREETYKPAVDISTYNDLRDDTSPFVENLDVSDLNADVSDRESLDAHHEQSQFDAARMEGQHGDVEETIDYQTSPTKDLLNFKPENLAMASAEMIEELNKKHTIFYNLLERIKETHAPNDFISAYHIQDRIAYLLDNPTHLYKNLVKQLIPYVDQINKKLQSYYDEISQKQHDLKTINAQISRFNEYARKSQDDISDLNDQKHLLKEEVAQLDTRS